jgi:Na+/H+-translocating membrane pyrophosphatase
MMTTLKKWLLPVVVIIAALTALTFGVSLGTILFACLALLCPLSMMFMMDGMNNMNNGGGKAQMNQSSDETNSNIQIKEQSQQITQAKR